MQDLLKVSVVDIGTVWQQAYIVRTGETHGVPPSRKCLEEFHKGWIRWAGWPKVMQFDRGLHNRGIFHKTLAKKGVQVKQAALESPEQIGRVERRSDVLKKMITKVTKETNATGEKEMDMVMCELRSSPIPCPQLHGPHCALWVQEVGLGRRRCC